MEATGLNSGLRVRDLSELSEVATHAASAGKT